MPVDASTIEFDIDVTTPVVDVAAVSELPAVTIDTDAVSIGITIDTAAVDVIPDGPAPVVVVATPGPLGPRGPAGDGGFTHTQTAPAATWTITNTLGRKPASVTIWLNDVLVDTDVETPDLSTIVLTFSSPQSGRAEII